MLSTVQGYVEDAVTVLRRNTSVSVVDRLEGSLGVLIVMEAPDRPALSRAVMKALDSVELMTAGWSCCPYRITEGPIESVKRAGWADRRSQA